MSTRQIIFGWAAVTKLDGQPYIFRDGERIEEAALLDAAISFMSGNRVVKINHAGRPVGEIVFAMPVVAETRAALGLETDRTGLLVGILPHDEDVIKKVLSGQLAGLSIAARGIRYEEDAA